MTEKTKEEVMDELLSMVRGLDNYQHLPQAFQQLAMASATMITASVAFNPITGQIALSLPSRQLDPERYQRLAEALQQAAQQVNRLALAAEKSLSPKQTGNDPCKSIADQSSES